VFANHTAKETQLIEIAAATLRRIELLTDATLNRAPFRLQEFPQQKAGERH
jgi:hypothetical protein